MRIAVIGAGAMGSIYGGHLSLHNDVWLIDTNPSVIEHLQKEGLILEEQGKENLYRPGAAVSSEGDRIICFFYSAGAGIHHATAENHPVRTEYRHNRRSLKFSECLFA